MKLLRHVLYLVSITTVSTAILKPMQQPTIEEEIIEDDFISISIPSDADDVKSIEICSPTELSSIDAPEEELSSTQTHQAINSKTISISSLQAQLNDALVTNNLDIVQNLFAVIDQGYKEGLFNKKDLSILFSPYSTFNNQTPLEFLILSRGYVKYLSLTAPYGLFLTSPAFPLPTTNIIVKAIEDEQYDRLAVFLCIIIAVKKAYEQRELHPKYREKLREDDAYLQQVLHQKDICKNVDVITFFINQMCSANKQNSDLYADIIRLFQQAEAVVNRKEPLVATMQNLSFTFKAKAALEKACNKIGQCCSCLSSFNGNEKKRHKP